MKVELTKDIDKDILKGTVLQEVEKTKKYYIGLWCSRFGTYTIKVKKKHCKIC